ncbi:hypothetical protein [Delftia sp. PS-11]|uniref:hypothetical protein n=1 Tax=Delftia sp. PS-11 TaxID=2767222 RepID=UPI0024566764|nr:hypothetical protein [Delftia sp. PS-11]KAJ8741791.1 hypothetical protein H9T68_20735 [Delftia sp. PS-11]
MRRRIVSSKYSRRRGEFWVYDPYAITPAQLAEEKKRIAEAAAKRQQQAATNQGTPIHSEAKLA